MFVCIILAISIKLCVLYSNAKSKLECTFLCQQTKTLLLIDIIRGKTSVAKHIL